jgi:DNA-binding FadR family transcriptional regulator
MMCRTRSSRRLPAPLVAAASSPPPPVLIAVCIAHHMPHVAEPEALRLHGLVASAVQARDSAQAESAMRAIVTESADAVEAMGQSVA